MKVYLVDGTYELFRHFFALPPVRDTNGQEVGAVRGVLSSVLSMIETGSTHIGVATDHVIESFRNQLYPHYKTGEGVPPALLSQFPILEQALEEMGVLVWPMVYYEADDALAAAAARASQDPRVRQVVICTPDKDLSQCVDGSRVVQLDRRSGRVRDEAGVVEKFGVMPRSIPDYLALVGAVQTVTQDCPGGALRLPHVRSHVFSILRASLRIVESGILQSVGQNPCPERCSRIGTMPSYSANLQRCLWMSLSLAIRINFVGLGRVRGLRTIAPN